MSDTLLDTYLTLIWNIAVQICIDCTSDFDISSASNSDISSVSRDSSSISEISIASGVIKHEIQETCNDSEMIQNALNIMKLTQTFTMTQLICLH